MELTHNEKDICMPVPRVQRATGFVCFFGENLKEKTVGRCELCDVWGVQASEIFNNSTFSSQDRSCCQSLWVDCRYSNTSINSSQKNIRFFSASLGYF